MNWWIVSGLVLALTVATIMAAISTWRVFHPPPDPRVVAWGGELWLMVEDRAVRLVEADEIVDDVELWVNGAAYRRETVEELQARWAPFLGTPDDC